MSKNVERFNRNLAIIKQSGLFFEETNNGECLLFRDGIVADFYPSTGRWRYDHKTYCGGAERFLEFIRLAEPLFCHKSKFVASKTLKVKVTRGTHNEVSI